MSSTSPSSNSSSDNGTSSSSNSPPPNAPSPLHSPPPPSESPPSNSTLPQSPPVSTTPPPEHNEPPPPPPSTTPPVASPPPETATPPPPTPSSPPPTPSSPPPTPSSPPPPPPQSSPPPPHSSPPPPITTPPPSPPPSRSPPPPPATPPESSPPPPSPPPPPTPRPSRSPPPETPPPPPESLPPPPPPPATPPESPPPPPPPPPATPPESPPPPTPRPTRSPPPRSSPPPRTSPPPRNPPPPRSSPPPPSSPPPETSPPPENSPPPPQISPPPPQLGPPLNSPPPPRSSPPPSVLISPPSFSPPLPSLVPPGNNTTIDNRDETSEPRNNQSLSPGDAMAIGLALGLVFLVVIGFAAFCVWRQKKRKPGQIGGRHIMPTSIGSSPGSDSGLPKVLLSSRHVRSSSSASLGNSRSWFGYEELVEATDGFSAQNLLGVGGFGSVYKGTLPDGRVVAVKTLKIGGGQGEREFKSEVEIISRIHHRHLVSLVGYCMSDEKRLLVYDYVSNNTLYFHLHGEDKLLNWVTRVKIASGAARGIAYLHEDCHPRIIHRDIKSSNILLDDKFEARVADFGLARLAIDTNTHVTTRVMGTFGYMAPEYASSGKLTDKSDVYSFGVVLLELVTGRKPVDSSQPLGEESLVEWARPLLSHALETEEFGALADPKLEGNYVDSEMFRLIEAAAACVRHSSVKRPKMGQVVRAFDTIVNSDLTNGMKMGESEIFNSAQQSAEIKLFQRMAFGSQDYSTDFFSQNSSSSGEANNNNKFTRRDL